MFWVVTFSIVWDVTTVFLNVDYFLIIAGAWVLGCDVIENAKATEGIDPACHLLVKIVHELFYWTQSNGYQDRLTSMRHVQY